HTDIPSQTHKYTITNTHKYTITNTHTHSITNTYLQCRLPITVLRKNVYTYTHMHKADIHAHSHPPTHTHTHTPCTDAPEESVVQTDLEGYTQYTQTHPPLRYRY